MKGSIAFGIPSGLLARQLAVGTECMGHQDDQREEAKERWGCAFDSQITPLALSFDAKMGATLFVGDLQRPTDDETGDNQR